MTTEDLAALTAANLFSKMDGQAADTLLLQENGKTVAIILPQGVKSIIWEHLNYGLEQGLILAPIK